MHLRHVSLPVADPAATAQWFAAVLDLPVTSLDDTWQVAIGAGMLSLRHGDTSGAHHLAFDISPASFAASRRWLLERVPLLSRDGEDEFEGPRGWSSRSLYFDGPEGSVLELIARRESPTTTTGSPDGRILGLTEVGIAVPDVRGTTRRLRAELDVPAYAAQPEESFAAVGDVHGLLILVGVGRRWFPTGDRYAGAARIDVDAVGGRAGTSTVGDGRLSMT